MFEHGDVAKMGPATFTVYAAIKAHTNFATGRAFPSLETITTKSGVSDREVKRCLKRLEEMGYISKERKGRNNVYTLREKIAIADEGGRPAAVASWDYLPSSVTAAQAELRKFLVTGEHTGQYIFIERLTIQNVTGDFNVLQAEGAQINGATFPAVDLAILEEQLTNNPKLRDLIVNRFANCSQTETPE
jgi:DNA-binding transcriptional MocR family regulator